MKVGKMLLVENLALKIKLKIPPDFYTSFIQVNSTGKEG